jgi:hypothetical protein
MTRIVPDTNIFISAILSPRSKVGATESAQPGRQYGVCRNQQEQQRVCSTQYAQKACAAYFAFTIFYVPTAYYLLAFAMNWFRKGSRIQKSKGSRIQGFKDSSGLKTLDPSTPRPLPF